MHTSRPQSQVRGGSRGRLGASAIRQDTITEASFIKEARKKKGPKVHGGKRRQRVTASVRRFISYITRQWIPSNLVLILVEGAARQTESSL